MRKGTVKDRSLWDRLVNDKWNGEQPVLSGEESIKAAKRLYRHAMKKPWNGEIRLTSGNRFTWVSRGVLSVNPDNRRQGVRGLRSIIHDISHYAHARLHPQDAPHSRRQAQMEGRLVTYAIKSGFLEGKLKSKAQPKAKPDLVKQRYAAILARRRKWEETIAKATRLRAKAAREQREYERRHGARLAA